MSDEDEFVSDAADHAEPELPVIVRPPRPGGGAGSLTLAVDQWLSRIVRTGPAAR